VSTAAYALFLAIDAALSSDAQLLELNVRYYASEAPPSARAPYIVGEGSAERPDPFLGQKGGTNTRTLHVWAKTEAAALSIYNELHRILDDTSLEMEGFETFSSSLRLGAGFMDPPSNLFHLVAEYEARIMVASNA
jgi:hypothetical protein